MSKKINVAKLQKEAEAARDEWIAKANVSAQIGRLLDNKLQEVSENSLDSMFAGAADGRLTTATAAPGTAPLATTSARSVGRP
jgi:hypothetical protein